MPPIGETLREARMRQRLDIADVEERTKIRAKYLRALENEEWGLLPGPTFVKTFLRTYAEVVGIDPHLLVEEYRVNHETRDEPDFQPLAPRPPRESRRSTRRPPPRQPPRLGAIVAVIAVALIAFLLVLGLLGGSEDAGNGGGQATSTQARTTTDPGNRKRQSQAPSKQPAPSGVNVRVAPIEPTYACVDSGPDTAVVFEGTLDAARSFRNPRLLRLNLGRRSATVTLNGKAVEVAEAAEPLALELTPKGSTELPAAEAPCA